MKAGTWVTSDQIETPGRPVRRSHVGPPRSRSEGRARGKPGSRLRKYATVLRLPIGHGAAESWHQLSRRKPSNYAIALSGSNRWRTCSNECGNAVARRWMSAGKEFCGERIDTIVALSPGSELGFRGLFAEWKCLAAAL